ncbi:MAG: type I restriction enzyme HsdR N-terminal domain-containing protein [Bacteroidales bacterium]|jgi:DNA modification methylase|nr:type I restriction enzyme HsdR N-terminal domain-containing protein [Bacteroidales bacterium]
MTKEQLFGQLDFRTIAEDPNFKEDSVREVIILPLLKALGYGQENIVRSKTLQHPFLKIGSNKKRAIKLIPDYALKIENNYAWILDAKSPNKKIINDENVEQVYSYVIHPEIRATYFALCNGLEFSLFRASNPQQPILFFSIVDIENHWEMLKMYLSSNSFQAGKNFTYDVSEKPAERFDYANCYLLEEIPVKKQAAKRHFGCNAYFTRQTWNVVQEYIKNFSRSGDLVLDPFGGSGVTAIEALMTGRKAIHVDLNPLSIFMVKSLIAPVCRMDLLNTLENIKTEYQKNEPKTDEEIIQALKKYKRPKNLALPKNADVETVEDLFSDKQIAQLALLKYLIKKVKNVNVRDSLLLAFYNTVSVINKTFHETPKGGGNHFGYYYRYRIAPDPAYKDTIAVFENKVKRIVNGKQEMSYFINKDTVHNAQIFKGSATNLHFLPKESVDYIYTDPPYGAKIPYLDLSIMWNAWLDLDVTEEDYALEAIEGGEHGKTKDEYNRLIAQSIKEMYRVLKFDRWLSFVFAHKDPEFWHLIIETAEGCGFEYIGAVPQKNGQTSFKKRQNPFTVLSGQLIINFRKVRNPRAIMKANLGMDISEIVTQTIEGVIAKNDGATLEQINDELIIKGLELGFLDLLKKEYNDLTPLLTSNFNYDDEAKIFTIRKDTRFTTNIDVHLRIKYYLLSYLRRKERENKTISFDEIVLEILPLLKNGTTPENQTILNILEQIAEHTGEGCWRLKRERTLFD